MDIKEIFKDNGILKKKNKNYKKRVSQIKAAILLEKAIKDKKHFILEGPCGFGKSISYLIPSIKNLIETNYDGRIVLVTSNISLQEQLYNKDLPFVLDVFDELYPNKKVLNNIKPDIIIVVAYGQILPKEVLDIPRLGCVNIHGSILPEYRGVAGYVNCI